MAFSLGGFLEKAKAFANKAISTVKVVVNNPVVQAVGNIAAPGIMGLVTKGVNAADKAMGVVNSTLGAAAPALKALDVVSVPAVVKKPLPAPPPPRPAPVMPARSVAPPTATASPLAKPALLPGKPGIIAATFAAPSARTRFSFGSWLRKIDPAYGEVTNKIRGR